MKQIIYLCFITVLLSSCTTSDNEQEFLDSDSNFYALTVGNEWVYKNYKYNPSTQAYDDTGVVDVVSIVGTEFLNGNTYYKMRRLTTGNEENITLCNPNGEYFELLRDSIGYLIRDDGSIKYANNNFLARSLNEQGWGTVYEQLIALHHEITVEAGVFESTYTQRYAILFNGEQANALDHFYYADGIGLVYDTSSTVSQDIPAIVRRLYSYNVQ